jgi:inhibitor of the pro-sigma K processing machinery
MSLRNALFAIFGAAVVIAALRIFRAPIKLAFKVLLNTLLGFAVLILFDAVSTYTGFCLGVNLVNSLVIGILGAPGLGLLLMARWLFTV